MGRWSKMLALPFLEFAGLRGGTETRRGCGNGKPTFALAGRSRLARLSQSTFGLLVEEGGSGPAQYDPRINESSGGRCDLRSRPARSTVRVAARTHFVPEAAKAVSEMRRVVRPVDGVQSDGDHLGGMPAVRMMVGHSGAISEGGRQFRDHVVPAMMQPGD